MKLNGNNTVSIEFDKLKHHHASVENPLRDDVFSIDDETKIQLINQKIEIRNQKCHQKFLFSSLVLEAI